jgi:D-alanine-D-alanine ligase
VSLERGTAVAAALASRGHRITRIDPAEVDLASVEWTAYDAAFLALHGTFGEDGHVQSLLESFGVPYTGSDAATSRLAFSKSASKERFAQHNVPTPAYVLIHESDDAARIHRHAQMLGYPLVVKPDAQGSSLGVSIVHSPDELPQALARCFHLDAFGILESYIAGSEWTVGLFNDEVLPMICIETARPFYDFYAKYEDDATQYHFDFALPTPVVKAIETAGRMAGVAPGTQGLARVDLRLDRYNQPWVLEMNTIPGFTSHSLVPKAAARLGISFSELCDRAVRDCLTTPVSKPNS